MLGGRVYPEGKVPPAQAAQFGECKALALRYHAAEQAGALFPAAAGGAATR